jgi:hypothetical protein
MSPTSAPILFRWKFSQETRLRHFGSRLLPGFLFRVSPNLKWIQNRSDARIRFQPPCYEFCSDSLSRNSITVVTVSEYVLRMQIVNHVMLVTRGCLKPPLAKRWIWGESFSSVVLTSSRGIRRNTPLYYVMATVHSRHSIRSCRDHPW